MIKPHQLESVRKVARAGGSDYSTDMQLRHVRTIWQFRRCGLLPIAGTVAMAIGACSLGGPPPHVLRMRQLENHVTVLEQRVELRNQAIARLERQIDSLQSLDPDRPADLFAPTSIALASLTGGSDFDGRPGDDGVTVYVRPRDQFGDTVKVPGRITVQLLDNSDLTAPRVLGVCKLADSEELRTAWYGKFGTGHYTIKCPFDDDASVPTSGQVTVAVEFLDYRSGAILTTTGQIEVAIAPAAERADEN